MRTVAVVLALVFAAGCGEDARDGDRDRVDAYVERQQELMGGAQAGFEQANRTYVAYARGRLDPATAADDVAAAERTLRQARDRLTVLDAPPPAARLHRELLRYLDANVDLAEQTTLLVGYTPAAEAALRPLTRANRRLQARLDDATGPRAQAKALERYGKALRRSVRDLRALEAPGVLAPAHDDQIRRLSSTARLAGTLRRALLAQDAERVARLLVRFRRAAADRGPDELATGRARAAYQERMDGLDRAFRAVRLEERRLDRALR